MNTHRLFSSVIDEDIIHLLERLIEIESHQNAHEREKAVAEYIEKFFSDHDIDVELSEVTPHRYNVIASVKGKKPGKKMLLNGHLDTVPAYGMKDAFIAKRINDRIYGRGSVDMKGALAAMMYTLVALKQSGIGFEGELIFAGTVGEETDSAGAYHLIQSGMHADYAIVGEPTNLEVGVAHKGVFWGEAVFRGKSVHGSVPDQGVNAIYHAASWIHEVIHSYIPAISQQRHDLLGKPTINIGEIEGGTRPVIVPNECRVRFERRLLPGDSTEAELKNLQRLIDQLRHQNPEVNGEVTELPVFNGIPHGPLETNTDSRLVKQLITANKDVMAREVTPVGLGFWTDAALLQALGCETVVCGPGDIKEAHSDEEFIEVDQLISAFRLYSYTAYHLLSGKDL